MRFVAVKSEEQQANGPMFRARDVLVRTTTRQSRRRRHGLPASRRGATPVPCPRICRGATGDRAGQHRLPRADAPNQRLRARGARRGAGHPAGAAHGAAEIWLPHPRERGGVQAPAPSRLITAGMASTTLVSWVSKFAWPILLNRQTQMLAGPVTAKLCVLAIWVSVREMFDLQFLPELGEVVGGHGIVPVSGMA